MNDSNDMRKMRSVTIALSLISLLTGCASLMKGTAVERPFLWSLEKDGRTSYVFGFSSFGVNAADLPDVVFAKANEAKTLVDQTSDKQMSDGDFEDLAYLRRGESLRTKLAPETWGKLRDLTDSGVTEVQLTRMRPWLAMMQVRRNTRIEVSHGMVMAARNPVTAELKKLATKQNKPVTHLQTKKEFYQFLDQVYTPQTLARAVDIYSINIADFISREVIAYRTGSTETLETTLKLTGTDGFGTPAWTAAQTELSKDWAREIDMYHEVHGTVFISVEAPHLVGPGNLLEKLQDKGFKISRL